MKISIIIPVYNVEKYLNQCLESIANQTFTDFEVLMINDGSTDNSETICKTWAAKDSRFKLYTKNNEGPSLARNYGLKRAHGEYICFIDSDDWVDERFLKALYNKAIDENADMSECDVYRYNNNTGQKTIKTCWGTVGREYDKEKRIKRGYSGIWRCLFKRSLWIDNNIEFPDSHSQAKGVYALSVALANKVACVREPLYYYRKFRENSLSAKPRINEFDHNAEGIESFKYLIAGFKRLGIFDKYKNALRRMLYIKSSESFAGLYLLREKENFAELVDNYKKFLKDFFPDSKQISYITFGGYNLNLIVRDMDQLNNPYLRFNFSSIISVMNPVKDVDIKHGNKYRQIMLRRDIESSFWEILEAERPEYLVMDFIEERFDIIKTGSGYITKSDAYDGATVSIEGEIIPRFSKECNEIWKKSCLQFIKELTKYIRPSHIILVKNYLSERHGTLDGTVPFGELESIIKVNNMLKDYYRFFEANCNCTVIDTVGIDNYFTDDGYEYGAIPSHLNEIVNGEIGSLIEEKFKE